MRNKIDIVKRYKPEISLEQILAFETGRPETYTTSKLVNTLCELLSDKQYLCDNMVAPRLGLDQKDLSGALKVITGMRINEIRAELIAKRIRQLSAAYPDAKTDDLAKAIGFADYSTLWRFIERNKKRFPELFFNETEIKNHVKAIVKQLMSHESITVQRLYIALPFYGGKGEAEACLRRLYSHSRKVADLAIEIAHRHPELGLNKHIVEESALLHNVGIVMTDTPQLHCHGREPYVKHGIIGAEWLGKHHQLMIAKSARLHLGSGLMVNGRKVGEVTNINPLIPLNDYNKLICYASCFYSVFNPDHLRTAEEIRSALSQYGEASVTLFNNLHHQFA